MLPIEFVEAAQFPIKWKEQDLQNYVFDKLKGFGYKARLEVKINGGRADIISDWKGGTIIECKKYLGRNEIYQALGQCHLYGLKNNYQFVIIGLSPPTNEFDSAMTTASMVQQDKRVQVIFLNLDSEWHPGASSRKVFKLPALRAINFKIPVLRFNPIIASIIFLVLYLGVRRVMAPTPRITGDTGILQNVIQKLK